MIATREEIRDILDKTALPYDCVDLVLKHLGEFIVVVGYKCNIFRSWSPLHINNVETEGDLYREINRLDKKGVEIWVEIYDRVNNRNLIETEHIKVDRRRRNMYRALLSSMYQKVKEYLTGEMELKADTIEGRGLELATNIMLINEYCVEFNNKEFDLTELRERGLIWKRINCLW